MGDRPWEGSGEQNRGPMYKIRIGGDAEWDERANDCEDVVEKRRTFLESQPSLDAACLIFVDESGFRLGTPPRHGWAPRGQVSIGRRVHQVNWIGRAETLTGEAFERAVTDALDHIHHSDIAAWEQFAGYTLSS